MKNKEIRAAIYIRVSTLDQAREGYSLEAQENTLRKWCSEKKYIVYDLYADRGISGKDFDHRPDMLRLMRDAREGNFEIVVFWALSRFTRSVQDLYSTLEKFQKWNISMVSYTEAFDTSTPMGRAMIGIVGVFVLMLFCLLGRNRLIQCMCFLIIFLLLHKEEMRYFLAGKHYNYLYCV